MYSVGRPKASCGCSTISPSCSTITCNSPPMWCLSLPFVVDLITHSAEIFVSTPLCSLSFKFDRSLASNDIAVSFHKSNPVSRPRRGPTVLDVADITHGVTASTSSSSGVMVVVVPVLTTDTAAGSASSGVCCAFLRCLSLICALCFIFHLRSAFAIVVPSIIEFASWRPVVALIGQRILERCRITETRYGSTTAIGDGVPCAATGFTLFLLERLQIVDALIVVQEETLYLVLALSLILVRAPIDNRHIAFSLSVSLRCLSIVNLYTLAASALASCKRVSSSRLLLEVLPVGRPPIFQVPEGFVVAVVGLPMSIGLSTENVESTFRVEKCNKSPQLVLPTPTTAAPGDAFTHSSVVCSFICWASSSESFIFSQWKVVLPHTVQHHRCLLWWSPFSLRGLCWEPCCKCNYLVDQVGSSCILKAYWPSCLFDSQWMQNVSSRSTFALLWHTTRKLTTIIWRNPGGACVAIYLACIKNSFSRL